MTTYTAQHKAATNLRSRTKATVTDVPTKPTASAIHDDVKDLFSKYGVEVPSTARVVVSFIACVAIGLGVGYIGGLLLETLVISALVFTGSVFFAMTIYVLGVLVTLYAAWQLGGSAHSCIMSVDFDRSYQKCSNFVVDTSQSVRGWFSNLASGVSA